MRDRELVNKLDLEAQRIGLSRKSLANLVGCSESWLGRVRRGEEAPNGWLRRNIRMAIPMLKKVVPLRQGGSPDEGEAFHFC